MDAEPLGARLRRLREARGLTQTDLARACIALDRRVDRVEIIRYEGDMYLPRPPTFAALALALGVSLDMLWFGEEEAERLAWEREHR